MLTGGAGAVAARTLCVPRNAEAAQLLLNLDHYNMMLLRTAFLDRRGGEGGGYGPADSCLSLVSGRVLFRLAFAGKRGGESRLLGFTTHKVYVCDIFRRLAGPPEPRSF